LYSHTIYHPKIQYVTHLSSIPRTPAEKITNQGLSHILPQMGYSSSTLHGISLGHKSYGGLGLPNIRVEQGARNLITLTKGLTEHSLSANMIKTVTKWWWYQLGLEKHPFKYKSQDITYVKLDWFNNLHSFLEEFQIKIDIQMKNYTCLRQNDIYIMEAVLQQKYSQKIVGNINQCRLYLHVITLSDITNELGRHITVQSYSHKDARTIKLTKKAIFQVSKPNKYVWSYWTKFLQTITHTSSRRLKKPLGAWIVPIKEVRKDYRLYRDETYTYKKTSQTIIQTHLQTKEERHLEELPHWVIPCLYSITGTLLPKYTSINTNLMPPIVHLPPIHLSLPDKIIIVTDESVHQDKSAYAWVVAKSNGDIIWQQKKRIIESNISSFRAKAMGVLSVLKALHENIKQQNTK
jgi:hypothetical protein